MLFALYTAMNNRSVLSYEDRYLLGYMKGYRIGMIETARKILIRCLHINGKEQGIVPAKNLILKVNRETDTKFLNALLFDVYKDKLPVKELEMHYDMYFLVPTEEKKLKSLFKIGDESI